MSVGVKRFPENPSLNDSERWSERVDALIAAICDEKNAGTEVLHGIVDGPNFARKPDMHLWPFKRRIAEVVLYKHLTVEKTLHPMSCAETAVLPSALKGALKCWLDLDVVKGQTCMDTALKDEYFKSILP